MKIMEVSIIITKAVIWLIVVIMLFMLSRKIILGHDEVFDYVFKKVSECYGYIRKCFCKEGSKVNDDRRAVQDDGETYDSSSVWED